MPVFHLLMAVGESWAVACVTSKYRLSVLWNEITSEKFGAPSYSNLNTAIRCEVY